MSRILIIMREIPPVGGGAGHTALCFAEELAQQGYQVDIITMHFGELPYTEERSGVSLYRLPVGRKHQDSSYFLEMLRFAVRAYYYGRNLLRRNQYQAIYSFSIVPDGAIATRLAKNFGVPVVVGAQGSDVPGYDPNRLSLAHKVLKPFWHWTVASCTALCAPSSAFRTLIQRNRPGQQVHIIPNGINPGAFTPLAKDGSFLICSRLIERKNIQLVLKALASITTPLTLHVIGDGPMKAELERSAKALTGHEVNFYGWLPNDSQELKELYGKASYFIQSSANESFGVSVVEAQASGAVVLASPIPVFREILSDTAIYFPELSADAIAKTMVSATKLDLAQFENLSKSGRERATSLYSWSSIVKSYLNLLPGQNASDQITQESSKAA